MKTIKKPLIFIGVAALAVAIIYTLKKVFKETQTSIISDNTLKALENEKANDLRNEIKEYHKNHNWDESKIKSYLQ
tara:strand:+ start:18104 stop:18331 length:228 start_codon:yes stop_codon:yes gene_type:complete